MVDPFSGGIQFVTAEGIILKYTSITGTKDILPEESYRWQHIEQTFRDLAQRYNFREIRTPVFELTQLFARGIGELTDIVGKEMYTFEDRSKNSLTLKPEMTAAVIRAYLQHNLGRQQPVTKLYYLSPMFRQERPQKGRLRQFHQFGLEVLGTRQPEADAEIIFLTGDFYSTLGIRSATLKINSVGCEKCRPPYREKLKAFLKPHYDKLSPDSQRRYESNPLRILDSKDENDKIITESAPLQKDHLCEECSEHFVRLQELLKETGTPYTVDGRIVRGLDYYTKTAFEFISGDLGSQDALSGGGRYDLLAEQLGGNPVPGVGVAGGIERLLLVMEANKLPNGEEPHPAVFLAAADNESRTWLLGIAQQLRQQGISCETDLLSRSLRAQMREASRQQARYTIIAGTEERNNNILVLKNMQSGDQRTVSVADIASVLKQLTTGEENAT
jgi:histidyl-tRNA synthetase